ncbi:hypothetical protein [Reyranella massiliensis]|uniref:hypothetical protein n=1 Tax=Reyranella massiliensis TaxID=445220 RepID=UPI000686EA57|nr:hypothetical protein [Reyranella massiliensis]
MTRRPSPQQAVDAWNKAHPVGTAVMVSKDRHEIVRGKTTSDAYVLGGHSAVILIDTIRGCYLLDRVAADAPALFARTEG